MKSEVLDEFDRKILALLKDDARINYSDIGDSVGLSRVAVKKRIDHLEKMGVIKGYKTIIDTKSRSEGMEFIMDITAIPDYYSDVTDLIAKDEYVRRIMIVTGESRILVQGYAPDYTSLAEYADALYYRMKGISRITFQVVLSVLKDVDGGIEYDKTRRIGKQRKHIKG